MTAFAQRCSTLAAQLAEPLAGTAPLASTWVAVEQEGPWGHRALTESHLDPLVGAALVERSAGTGVTVVLVRRPGRHADPAEIEPLAAVTRQVWIGHGGTTPWLRRWAVEDPAELLQLDFDALGAGVRPRVGTDDPERMLLVCTNSRRDECCALLGRPVATALASGLPRPRLGVLAPGRPPAGPGGPVAARRLRLRRS